MTQKSIVNRIAKNTIALFTAQIVTTIFSVLLSIFIARNLGDVIFGKFSFALAFIAFFTIFSKLGYNTLLIREVARDKSQANRYLNNILFIRALLSLVVFAFIVVTINVMGYPEDTKNIIYLFSISILITSLSSVFKNTFRAFEKMEYSAGITIFINMLRVSFGLLILFLGYGLVELALVFIFSSLFELLLGLFYCEKKLVKSKTELDFSFFKNTIKASLQLSMLLIFGFIYINRNYIAD